MARPLQLKVRMTNRLGDPFGADLQRRIDAFLTAEKDARVKAAQLATAESRRVWNARINKRHVAARPMMMLGRTSTGGKLASHVKWEATSDGGVEVDIQSLDRRAPHWIIQEIGTGGRATIRQGGAINPKGRPKKGATYIRTVKSQSGRPISRSLVWATKGGVYSKPPGTGREQLQLRQLVKNAPTLPGKARGMRIRREIQGQHFVQSGGTKGFRQYESSVLSAARQAFRKSNRP